MISHIQAEAAIKKLRLMIEAAENSNQAGEDAVVAAAAGPDLVHALQTILPMARGYAAEHKVGRNAEMITWADGILARAEGGQWADERETEDA